ncbi:MAG: hypothetical protein VX032_04330, partial [SAR324 cluster bacterium]|nr:hypothetical protein [SAR324 cluster bacterium]
MLPAMLIQCPECHRRYEFAIEALPDTHRSQCVHCNCLIPLPGPPSVKHETKANTPELRPSPEGEAAYRRSTTLTKSETRPAPPPVEPVPPPPPPSPVQETLQIPDELAGIPDSEPANPADLQELRGLLGVPLPPGRKTQGTEFVPPPKPTVSESPSLLEQAPPKKEDTESLLHDSPPTEETEEAQSLFERTIHESFPEKSEPKEQSSIPLFEDDGAVPEIPAPKPPLSTKPTTQPETTAASKPAAKPAPKPEVQPESKPKKPVPPQPEIPSKPPLKQLPAPGPAPEQAKAKEEAPTVSQVFEKSKAEAGIPWMRLTLVSTLASLGLLLILWTGGYLHMVDSPLLSRLVGVQLHQFEFVGNLRVEKFRNNFSRQAIHVMTGTVRSNFSDSSNISSIRLKGLAFDDDQKILESQVVYAGVVLSHQELSEWSVSRIREQYKERYGRNEINRNLREGEELPFQVVFFEAGELFSK